MGDILSNLSKEDLIAIIGNMHDSIQDWDGYGYTKKEINVLDNVGEACREHLSVNDLWRDALDKVSAKIDK